MSLVDKIYQEFVINDFKWRRDGRLFSPTRRDIKDMLDSLAKACEDEGTQASHGRIIAVREQGHLDIYLHQGEYTDG